VRRFLKELFVERGGYENKLGEQVDMVWRRGEDPRFELLDMHTHEVTKEVSLVDMSVEDIEELLARHGFAPRKNR